MKENVLFWEALFVISSVPARNYLLNVSHWGTRLRMKTLERCQWRLSSVFVLNSEHISNFVLIVDFEQTNICWVYVEKTNTFADKIGYSICLLQYFKYKQNLLPNSIWTYTMITLWVNQWEVFAKEFTSHVDSS